MGSADNTLDRDEAIMCAISQSAEMFVNPQNYPAAFRAALAERGWVVVPREPTEAQELAGYNEVIKWAEWSETETWPDNWGEDGRTPECFEAILVYRAMLAASE